MKKVFLLLALIVVVVLTVGCSSDADVASRNLSVEADQFKVTRRIVFYNGITSDYILVIEGKCSLGNADQAGELSVTCKTGQKENGVGVYKKHFLGLSDNVTYFAEQIEDVGVSAYHYKVIFKPVSIVPDVEMP